DMLSLVETEKDYSDAIQLIEEKYKSIATQESEIQSKIIALSKKYELATPDFIVSNQESNEGTDVASTDVENDKPEVKRSMWGLFFEGLGWGFFALFTPCVFPMIPMTVSFFTKQSGTRSKGIFNALFYGLSIIGIYVAVGLIITLATGSPATVYFI